VASQAAEGRQEVKDEYRAAIRAMGIEINDEPHCFEQARLRGVWYALVGYADVLKKWGLSPDKAQAAADEQYRLLQRHYTDCPYCRRYLDGLGRPQEKDLP
jgi:hypothetical protein